MSDEEDIIDEIKEEEEEVIDESIQLSEKDISDKYGKDDIIENSIIENIEDINVFNKNYSKLINDNRTTKIISKYEKTKIISKRCEQLENGCNPLIDNYEIFDNIYDIVMEEYKQKKIPFILKRFINNKYEYWKFEDLIN